MSRWDLGIFCAALACAGLGVLPAAAQQPGFNQINVHNPFSPQYVPMTPIGGGFSGYTSGPLVGTTYTYYSSPGFYGSGYYPYYGGYYPGYASYWGGPVFGRAIFAPLVLPPDTLFGPRAMMRFMGVDNSFPVGGQQFAMPQGAPAQAAPAIAAQPADAAAAAQAPNVPVARGGAKPRASNADARARSQRFIVLGDGYFAKQAYSDANQRYRLAVQAAPDMADGHLRQGMALLALGHYDTAARSLKRGLQLNPAWSDSGFTLDELYGDAALAIATHIEALRQEAARAPSADTLFLLGLMLFFDGQRAQAAPIFDRARALAAGDDAHIVGFLQNLRPQAPANDAPGPEVPVAGGGANAGQGAAAGAGKPKVLPIAQRNIQAARAAPVPPFSAMPAAPAHAAPATPALPRSLPPSTDRSDIPARDL